MKRCKNGCDSRGPMPGCPRHHPLAKAFNERARRAGVAEAEAAVIRQAERWVSLPPGTVQRAAACMALQSMVERLAAMRRLRAARRKAGR